MKTAQATPVSNTQEQTLSNAVQSINAEVASLYSVEQTLASDSSLSVSASATSVQQQVKSLQQQRQSLIKQINQEWHTYTVARGKQSGHGKSGSSSGTWSQALQQWHSDESTLTQLNKRLSTLQNEQKELKRGSINSTLKTLQQSILNLQGVAIAYTKEWIALNQGQQVTTTLTAPSKLQVRNLQSTSWTVTWSPVANATSYDVYLNGTLVASNVTSTSYTFQNETPGTTYDVTVSAVGSNNTESAQSTALTVTTPISVSASQITNSGWVLQWTPVSGASYYDIYVNGYRAATNVTGTSYTFANQSAGKRYTIRVVAYNSADTQLTQSNTYTVTTLS